MRALAERKDAALLYGTNFSFGVQALFRLARELALAAPHYHFTITEIASSDKKDAPSGTALSIRQVLQAANPSTQNRNHLEAGRRRLRHSHD